jgi:hypothetical protein
MSKRTKRNQRNKTATNTTIIIFVIIISIGSAIYLTVQKEQAKEKRVEIINNDIDKIVARMNRVLNEPEQFNIHTKKQRDDDETRLLQIASSVKAEINDILIEMKANGYPYVDKVNNDVNMFFAVYRAALGDKIFSYDIGELGDEKLKNDADANYAKESQDCAANISDVQTLKVESSNLTN